MMNRLSDLTKVLHQYSNSIDLCLWLLGVCYFSVLTLTRIPQLLTSDISFQLSTVFQFLNGNGFAHTYAFNPADLSELTYLIEVQWPHGYPILVALAYYFVGDLVLATAIIEITFVALFYGSVLMILRTLNPPFSIELRAILFFYWIFVASSLSGPSEIIAISLLYFAVSIWLKNLQSRRMGWMFIVGMVIGLTTSARYAYMPFVVILPMVCVLLTLVYRQWWRIGQAGSIALGTLLTASIVPIYNQLFATSSVRTDVVDGGLYWSNLRLALPVGSLFSGNWVYISQRLNIDVTILLWFLTVVLIAVVLWVVCQILWHWWSSASESDDDIQLIGFVWFGFLLSGATIAMLVVLSVVNQPLGAEGAQRTFITNARYYYPMVVWVSMMLSLFIMDYQEIRTRMGVFWGRLVQLSLLPMLPGIFVAILLNGVVIYRAFTPPAFYTLENDFAETNEVFSILKQAQADEPMLVLVGQHPQREMFEHLSLLSGNYFYDGEFDLNQPFVTNDPVEVLIMMPAGSQPERTDISLLMDLISQHEGYIAYTIEDNFDFYRVTVTPE